MAHDKKTLHKLVSQEVERIHAMEDEEEWPHFNPACQCANCTQALARLLSTVLAPKETYLQ